MRWDRYRGICLSCPRPRDPKLPLEKGRPMLGSILIVDGNAYNGFGLSLAIEENDGCVAGPVATAADARIILDSRPIAGAIVDCDDDGSEAADVVMLLRKRHPDRRPDGLAHAVGASGPQRKSDSARQAGRRKARAGRAYCRDQKDGPGVRTALLKH